MVGNFKARLQVNGSTAVGQRKDAASAWLHILRQVQMRQSVTESEQTNLTSGQWNMALTQSQRYALLFLAVLCHTVKGVST